MCMLPAQSHSPFRILESFYASILSTNCWSSGSWRDCQPCSAHRCLRTRRYSCRTLDVGTGVLFALSHSLYPYQEAPQASLSEQVDAFRTSGVVNIKIN